MLDGMLSNIFGRSKKQTTAKEHNPTAGGVNNGETTEGFVVLPTGHPTEHMAEEPSLYPRVHTMLTQEMIVGQTTTTTSVRRIDSPAYNSPIDNIPFTSLLTGHSGHMDLMDPNQHSVAKCLATIDRIQQYLSSRSQSEYNFHLENTILSESLLS